MSYSVGYVTNVSQGNEGAPMTLTFGCIILVAAVLIFVASLDDRR